METNLLDRMLNAYQAENAVVTITLQNKIRVSGRIKAFDSYVIIMEDHKREIVYRHAVSSLAPAGQEEGKRPAEARKNATAKPAAPRPAKVQNNHKRPDHPPLPRTSGDGSINNSMKEGLLKWMQGQKSAK